MDSFGSLPLGCSCGTSDSLDIDTPADDEIFDQIVPKATSGPSAEEKSANDSISKQEIQQNSSQEPVLVAADNIADSVSQVFFPQILPPNPPNRRVPPLFRWAVHINHRSNDGPLPSAVERRMAFAESIRDVPYDANAQGREYRERQEYEWKKLLG